MNIIRDIIITDFIIMMFVFIVNIIIFTTITNISMRIHIIINLINISSTFMIINIL